MPRPWAEPVGWASIIFCAPGSRARPSRAQCRGPILLITVLCGLPCVPIALAAMGLSFSWVQAEVDPAVIAASSACFHNAHHFQWDPFFSASDFRSSCWEHRSGWFLLSLPLRVRPPDRCRHDIVLHEQLWFSMLHESWLSLRPLFGRVRLRSCLGVSPLT